MRTADCTAQGCGHRERQNIQRQNKPPLCALVTGLIVRTRTNESGNVHLAKRLSFPLSPVHQVQVIKSPEAGLAGSFP